MKRFNAALARVSGRSAEVARVKKKKKKKKKKWGTAVIAGDFNREYTCHDSRRYSSRRCWIKCEVCPNEIRRSARLFPRAGINEHARSCDFPLPFVGPGQLANFPRLVKSLYRDAASLVYEGRKIVIETLFNYRGKQGICWSGMDRSLWKNEIRSFSRNEQNYWNKSYFWYWNYYNDLSLFRFI